MPKAILIVEDNELNMKLFNDVLQAHGYNTEQVKMAGWSWKRSVSAGLFSF